MWKSSDGAEAESGIAWPSISNLYPVVVKESGSRNAEEGNGRRQWSGLVLSQKLVPEIEISSTKSSSCTDVFSFSQDSPVQSSISGTSDASSARHPDSNNRETSRVAIVLLLDIGTITNGRLVMN